MLYADKFTMNIRNPFHVSIHVLNGAVRGIFATMNKHRIVIDIYSANWNIAARRAAWLDSYGPA